MSNIGKNIKKIRTVKKLSQASFAELFNLARPSVGAYEEGRAEPKIETIIQIASHFGLSVDILLTKDLTINELYRFDSLKARTNSGKQNEIHITHKEKVNFNTSLINASMYWDYLQSQGQADFIDKQPKFHLPWIKSIAARAFEMDSTAMEFDNSGIQQGDLLVCEKKITDFKLLHIDSIYVFVTKDNIYTRRLLEKNGGLKLKPDNPDWNRIDVPDANVLEIWEVLFIASKNLSPPQQVNKRIANLEEKIEMLNEKFNNLNIES